MRLRHLLFLCAFWLGLLCSASEHTDTLRVMTLNLHAGHDASLEEIGAFIKQYQPDFVALQEVDHHTHRANCRHQNDRDFITELAYHSGMQGLFGPTITFSGGLYGIGLLTRHPFVEVKNHKLPHPTLKMEQRGLLEGTFVLPDGDTLIVACTHLEAFDSISRVEQAQFIQQHFVNAPYPIVLSGDFNAAPDDLVIQGLNSQWLDCTNSDPTFSVEKPNEKIDYIFARPRQAWHPLESEVIPVKLSDHFPVIATIVITSQD